MRDCHYITSPIVYWGKGSTVGWYKVSGFLLLVIVCLDNNGFSKVVTLNSPSGIFALQVFHIRKQITVSNLLCAAFNLVGDLFVLSRVLHVNWLN